MLILTFEYKEKLGDSGYSTTDRDRVRHWIQVPIDIIDIIGRYFSNYTERDQVRLWGTLAPENG